jgi:hypothetical protein
VGLGEGRGNPWRCRRSDFNSHESSGKGAFDWQFLEHRYLLLRFNSDLPLRGCLSFQCHWIGFLKEILKIEGVGFENGVLVISIIVGVVLGIYWGHEGLKDLHGNKAVIRIIGVAVVAIPLFFFIRDSLIKRRSDMPDSK